ncbi:hypothetical protein [Bradyrhizobium sp. SZCCHNRI2007]|uniref:hypothetical protein n=2 Tax=unclassified Bradyrhizobium TaxID=2631580 RepID=UPI0028EF314C|nr:hypothetical protein [Bradyrhizobium sp. SZCCHNRI2007]
MMSIDRGSLRTQLLNEVSDEMSGLDGGALDEYLSQMGFEPKELLVDFEASLRVLDATKGRRRFDMARAVLSSNSPSSNVLNLEASRKQSVFTAVKERMAATGEMTVAARNQRIASEEDLDSFLAACLRLGIIDENGDLKD